MIAPAVLAMIHSTTKGMLMTKLKLGALALVMMGGLVGSGMGLGGGRNAAATDGLAQQPSNLEPAPPPTVERSRFSPRAAVESEITSAVDADPTNPIPPPADGPGFPYLLEFFETQTVAGLKNHQEVASLARHGYPIKSFDVAIYSNGASPGRKAADRYEVNGYPTILLVDGTGDEIARIGGLEGPAKIAAFYNEFRSKSAKKARGVDPSTSLEPIRGDEPGLTIPSNPKPWETVVRIKIKKDDKEWQFGSGTIISSSAEGSIILTAGHIFRLPGSTQPPPVHFRAPISVDLFDGHFVKRGPATLSCSEKDLPGEVIDYDFTSDVGLIRIRPGRELAASKVVPPRWRPMKGMKMYAVGCSHGQDATAWDTTILDPRVGMRNTATNQSFAMIKCAHQPKPGRTGGGLYTTDGYVAGVCAFADPNEHVGLYAVPEAIHRLLDRNGLSSVFGKATDGGWPEPVELEVDPVITEDLGGPDARGNARWKPAAPTTREPVLPRAVSDQDHRLNELERKLDQVLKALEDLKGEKASDQLKGDFPRKR
jgi:hypothetical protein